MIAPANAFKQFGESLTEYYASSIEPSYLYLGNRFVQFAHSRCLREEMEVLGRNSGDAPSGARWPENFPEILKFARAGWPREFDTIAQIGGDAPHFNYPLRQLGESNLRIQGAGVGFENFESEIGNIAYHQAIREAYPGATYLHAGRRYKVVQWRHEFSNLTIRVQPTKNLVQTRPILRKSVTLDLSRQGIIADQVKKAPTGLVAEVQIQVNESVEGFSIGNSRRLYRYLRADDPNMRRKQRDFRTTGVVVQIEDDWFSQAYIRREIAEGLRDLLARDRSIAPQDIDATHTNIAVLTEAGPKGPITDMIVVYDSVYGGLRLTENLFDEFERYVRLLGRAVDLAGDNGIVSAETVASLQAWSTTLSVDTGGLESASGVAVPEGWLQVFKPGSVVGVFRLGDIIERELIEPVYDDFHTGTPALYYRYRDDNNKNGISLTPFEGIQPAGHEWEWVLWNPETGEYKDLEITD